MALAAEKLDPVDRVPPGLDVFFDELEKLGREIRTDVSEEDLRHLQRIERLGRLCTTVGWATSFMGPNVVSIALLAQGRTTRWATVAHHISHGGYKRVPGVPERYTPKRFAKGKRRLLDWFDVIQPEAWHVEHNQLHHTRLGEPVDPDLVEDTVQWLRDADWSPVKKYAMILTLAVSWKWIFYAPGSLLELMKKEADDRGEPIERRSILNWDVWDIRTETGKRLWGKSLLPYAAVNFGFLPLLFAPFGPLAVASSATNSFLAEVLTNLQTFLIITTNHAGEDVMRFEDEPRTLREYRWRQIVGSVNYRTGGDVNDMLHGWLNYQIEHHIWPDLSALQYRKVQPKVKALCEEHGVPYIQESVWTRLRKTLDIMTGEADMKREPSFQ